MNAPARLTVHGQPVRLVSPTLPRPRVDIVHQPLLPEITVSLPEPSLAPGEDAAAMTARHDEQARHLVGAAARNLLEVLQQRRSPGQVSLWMGDDAQAVLLAWGRRRSWRTSRLTRVRACRVGPRAVEGCVHLHDDDGDLSVLLRLEHGYGRWRVVVFDVLAPAAAVLADAC